MRAHRDRSRAPEAARWAVLALLAAAAWPATTARAARGGPDVFGHTWSDAADGCASVADPAALPDQVSFWDGSRVLNFVGPFDLPFRIPFYDRTVDRFWVHRAGVVSFERPPDDPLTVPQPIPTVDGLAAFVAPYWTEHDEGSLSSLPLSHGMALDGVHYQVEFHAFDATGVNAIGWALLVHPSGDLRVEYFEVPPAPQAGTVGLEAPSEIDGLQLLHGGVASAGLVLGSPAPYTVCFRRPAALGCAGAPLAGCGLTSDAVPSGALSTAETYSCDGGLWSGGERVFSLDLSVVTDLDVTVSSAASLGAFLLSTCDERDCLAGGLGGFTQAGVAAGTYLLVVDGATAADSGSFDLEITCGGSGDTLACGETIVDVTSGTGTLNAYPCLPVDAWGPESFYTLELPTASHLTIDLESTIGHSIFLFAGAGAVNPLDCIAGSQRRIALLDQPAGTYTIVVESPFGSGGPFTLSAACGPQLGCNAGSPTLGCNDLLVGTTVGRPARVDAYGCTGVPFSGPEAVHVFTNPVQQDVSFTLDTAVPELDLVLLDASCDEAACLGVNDFRISRNLAPGTYVLVVDGRDGLEGDYVLSAACGTSLEPALISVTAVEGQCFDEHKIAWLTPAIPKADVLFAIDLTGSMGDERAQLQVNMQDIIDRLSLFVDDVAFGLVSHKDYASTGLGTTPCPYDAADFGSAGNGDYPYRLEQPITTDRAAIQSAVDGLPTAFGGLDSPESYSRVLFEAYSDAGLAWRPDARRLVVTFGDEMPHDCNVLECFGETSWETRGVDLGPDDAPDTGDELPILDVIQGLRDARTTLLHLDSSGGWSDGGHFYHEIWDCWARRTGGEAVALGSDGRPPSGIDLAQLVAGLIEAQASLCTVLELVAEPGWEDWLVSSTPVYADVELPTRVEFDIRICVPPGTPPGVHDFQVRLVCSGGLAAFQRVHVEVVDGCAPSVVSPPPNSSVCLGDAALLDGSGVGLAGCPSAEHEWRDSSGNVVGLGPVVEVRPTETTTYELVVSCPGLPACTAVETATVEVVSPPVAGPAVAADLASCNVGLEVSWQPAVFSTPDGLGFYNVYRSETSCADALLRPPVALGLTATRWVDPLTRPGRSYHYVVEAEDPRPGGPCRPGGPFVGGAVDRACVDPAVLDVGDAPPPEPVWATLRVRHDADAITATWDAARALAAGETYRLLKTWGDPTNGFVTANGSTDRSRAFSEADASSPLQFFDLRVANACEQLSIDEYPPSR
jgi:hypothetical protein